MTTVIDLDERRRLRDVGLAPAAYRRLMRWQRREWRTRHPGIPGPLLEELADWSTRYSGAVLRGQQPPPASALLQAKYLAWIRG